MEIKKAIPVSRRQSHRLCAFFFLLLVADMTIAQSPARQYTVKNGNMYIELSKQLPEVSLDSFIAQYDLGDLFLKEFIRSNMADSLYKRGWKIEKNDPAFFMISKPLFGFDNIANPADKIIFTGKHGAEAALFPAISSKVAYGANRFKNKNPFAAEDSVVTFFLRNNTRATRVILSGSFSNWSEDALPMTKTDSGWIASVKLGAGKYWYKFIVDGNWMIDKDNQLSENDGLGNVNSVFYNTNYLLTLDTFLQAKKVFVAGSFNEWRPAELQMVKTSRGWQLPLYLANGTHTYRFIVDNKWMADPFNPDKLPNEFYDFNSVIRLGKPYLFQLDGYTDAKQVVLSGSFNSWRRDELFMHKTANGWELPYTLGPGNYEYNFIIDGKWVASAGKPEGSAGEPGNLFFIIAPNYTFILKGFENAKTVYLAGDFNNWSPNSFAMKKEGDLWILPVHLSPGKHLYKFVVDGNWIIDPTNKLWEQNEHNSGNSVIWVEPAD